MTCIGSKYRTAGDNAAPFIAAVRRTVAHSDSVCFLKHASGPPPPFQGSIVFSVATWHISFAGIAGASVFDLVPLPR